jgi:hypothetical protein
LTLVALPAGGVTLSWTSVPEADWYAVTRGTLSALAPGQLGSCLDPAVVGTQLDDLELPEIGEGYAYLVNAVGATCGPGSLGDDSTGEERINNDAAACD